jgi:predicted acylesterase/phospholipase RssA
MTIRHLCISGGGIAGLTFYGILREAHKHQFWKLEEIQTMFGSSVGSLLSVILCLGYDWELLDNYFIKRPWNTVFKFDIYSVIQSFDKRGIFGPEVIEEVLAPLFSGKDVPLSITMREFFDLTGVELHLMTTEANTYTNVDISHLTHPDWRVIDAVYCSCAIPIVFSPIIRGDECYIDGDALVSYPIVKCRERAETPDEIFGLKKEFANSPTIRETSSLFDFIIVIGTNVMRSILGQTSGTIKNEILVRGSHLSIDSIIRATSVREERETMISHGAELFISFAT